MEMLRKRMWIETQSVGHLPCAGITLIRFYGYYLSFALLCAAPRELNCHKLFTTLLSSDMYKCDK